AAERVIKELFKVKDSYNLGTLPQVAGTAALTDRETMRRNVEMVLASRKHLLRGLQFLAEEIYPSQSNFVLARFTSMPAEEISLALKERKILVRYFKTPRLDDCLRISIGTDREINALLSALEEILGKRVTKT
ncbi:MAG: aminotransferase class I/II-fold pyridoxal phosphate-dependent enzyme, partial [Planctomycetes bacterium]|nr:aminotransferase class I/II-fold pyridoxal phosphate-dependent enzyme [Planctomycetota bacterium]